MISVDRKFRERIIKLATWIKTITADMPPWEGGNPLLVKTPKKKEKTLNDSGQGQTSLLEPEQSLEEIWGENHER